MEEAGCVFSSGFLLPLLLPLPSLPSHPPHSPHHSPSPSRRTIPPDGYPEPYYSNTHKETLVVGFVRNFERQFKQLYGQRKPLLTVLPNEFGVEVGDWE